MEGNQGHRSHLCLGPLVSKLPPYARWWPELVTFNTCSGPRAYAGVVSAYHETVTSNFQRLTDQQWTTQVGDAAVDRAIGRPSDHSKRLSRYRSGHRRGTQLVGDNHERSNCLSAPIGGTEKRGDPSRDRPLLADANGDYWQAAAVASGPGPTGPLVLLVRSFPMLTTVAVEPHGIPMPYSPLNEMVEF